MYCYLRVRFGKPNGLISLVLIRKNTADNFIHWDFHLKCGDHNVYVMGFSKQMQFVMSERFSDDDWRSLIKNIKVDFGRIGKEKSKFQDHLERWAIFPRNKAYWNRLQDCALICTHQSLKG